MGNAYQDLIDEMRKRLKVEGNSRENNWSVLDREIAELLKKLRVGQLKIVEA